MKQPIAIILTDTHSKDGNEELVENIFHQAFDLCKKLNIDSIIHAGDWFQYRSLKFESSLKCFLSIEKVLEKAFELGIKIHAIQGNHDKPDLTSSKGYLSILKNPGSLYLYEEETIVPFGNILICFLPFFKAGVDYLSRLSSLVDEVKEYWSNQKNIGKTVLITHAAINGVRDNDGGIQDWDAETGYFDNFDLVISGHYHNAQSITKSIQYIGSAYQANFGEDIKKGFTVLHDDLSLKHVSSYYPQYVKMRVDIDTEFDAILDMIDNGDIRNSGDKVQIIFHGKEDKLAAIDRNHPLLKGLDVRFEADEKEIPFTDIEDAELVVFDKKNIARNWIEYAKQANIDSTLRSKGLKMLTTMRIN